MESLNGLAILDIFIGLAFVYFSLSLIASSALEFIVALTRYRAIFLKKAISNILDTKATEGFEDSLTQQFFTHPLIAKKVQPGLLAKLSKQKKPLAPSYLSGDAFAELLLEILKTNVSDPAKVKSASQGIQQLPGSSELKQLLLPILAKSTNESDFITRLSHWYDEYMERQTGKYKRFTQKALFVLGLILAIPLNINSLEYAEALAQDGALRNLFVAKATDVVKKSHEGEQLEEDKIESNLKIPKELNFLTDKQSLAFLIANETNRKDEADNQCAENCSKSKINESAKCEDTIACQEENSLEQLKNKTSENILGYLITAVAVSLGSAFWLNLLRMMISIRSSVATTRPISSEDKHGSADKYKIAPQVTAQFNFESYLDPLKIEELQNILELDSSYVTGNFNAATRDAIDEWRINHNIPITGSLTLDEYLKLKQ